VIPLPDGWYFLLEEVGVRSATPHYFRVSTLRGDPTMDSICGRFFTSEDGASLAPDHQGVLICQVCLNRLTQENSNE
jgi:hypothetical protein